MSSGTGGMRLKVLRMGGDSYDIDVTETATCQDLKRQLAARANLPADRQRLIFRGRVLQDELLLSEAGVANGHTLHLVDMPAAAAPGPTSQAQQGAAMGRGTNGMDFSGGLLGGFGAMPGMQGGGAPGGIQGSILGPFVVSGDAGGAGGDFGAMIAQQIAAALGGVPDAAGQQPQPHQGVARSANLRMPILPAAPTTTGLVHPPPGQPYPHVLTGLNLMMSRMEHEYNDPELDPLPRIREYYGRPSPQEVLHFLRAARTLLNSAQLLRPTRAAIDGVLAAAGLPALRARPWQHYNYDDDDEEEEEEEEESEEEESEESDGQRRQQQQVGRRHVGRVRGGRGSSQTGRGRGAALSSFPVPAEEASDDEDADGSQPWHGARPAPAASSAAQGHAAGGDDNAEDDMPALAEEDDDDDDEEEEFANLDRVSNEQLMLVAAVALGELAARFLDLVGANSDDPLWDMADRLRSLTRVRSRDLEGLAEDVQQLTARLYRTSSVWAELSRGMQYLGAALESGNMAVVSAIPGYLSVQQGSQAIPNLQRPGFPPFGYLPPNNGYFGGQIPDGYSMPGYSMPGMAGVPVDAAVVDIAMAGPTPAGFGAVRGQSVGGQQQQQQQQQQGAQQGAAALPAAAGQNLLGSILSGMLGGLPLGAPLGAPPGGAPAAAGAAPGPGTVQLAGGTLPEGPQQTTAAQAAAAAQQAAGARALRGSRQALEAVDQLVGSTRASVDQAAERVQEARNAMQAVITGREGGPQAVLQRSHQTMQALVSAEEAMRRARQRCEQAAQHLQRVLRAHQQQQQQGAAGAAPGQPQLLHQAVRITLGGPGGAQQAQQQGAAAGQQGQQRTVAIPIGALLQQALQGAYGQQRQPQQGAGEGAGASQAAGAAQAAAAGEGPEMPPINAFAQQLLEGMGMSPAAQQDLLQQFSGVTQALRQSSIAALDLPALLEEIRAVMGSSLHDVAQQVSAVVAARQQAQEAGSADEVAAVTEAAVPQLTDAVHAVLGRHLARLAESPALRQFIPHLQDIGINLQPLQAGGAPAAAAGPASAASQRAVPVPQPAPTPPPATRVADRAAAAAAAVPAAAPAAPGQEPAPEPAATAPAPPAPHPAQAHQPGTTAAASISAAAEEPGVESRADAAASSHGGSQPKPAGLGLGRGLGLPGRPTQKKRHGSVAKLEPSSADASVVKLAQAAVPVALSGTSTTQAADSSVGPQDHPEAELPAGKQAVPAAATPAVLPGEADKANAAAAGPVPTASEPPTEPAPAASGMAMAIPPRPAGRGASGTGGPNLASLMSGLLGGPPPGARGGGGGTGGAGGGLMDLMGSVMQSPAFMQMAQSPAMQQMAEQMLGGGGPGGGGLDLGSLMGNMLGGMAGPAAGAGPRADARARGLDGVLGAAGDSASSRGPADIDSVLSVLPPEEAARWRETLEGDAERLVRMAEGSEEQADGFSDAYSALRMAGARGGGSGLLRMLAGAGAEEEEQQQQD